MIMSVHIRETKREKGPYFTIYEKYWDPSAKRSRFVTIESPGYLFKYSEQFGSDPDAEEKARKLIYQRYEEIRNEREKDIVSLTLDMQERNGTDTSDTRNIGYFLLKEIYKELEIDRFWKRKSKGRNFSYDPDKIFQLLVFARVIFPGSKKYSYENRKRFFEDFDGFSLDDLYHCMDLFAECDEELQKWIYDHSVTKYKRDLSAGYFDCTNYYYDISRPDTDDYDEEGDLLLKRYRKYGPEKNHRRDPIVEMGLLMDKSGIPLSYDLFPGNESEKVHMLPVIKRTRRDYGIGRIIIVADRGLNTSDNIYLLNGNNKQDRNPRDGYIYGQSVRGADEKFREWVLDQEGYIDTPVNQNDPDKTKDKIFRHKSRIYPKKICIKREKSDGSIVKQNITVDQKQLVYYSEKYAEKQRLDRERAVERAKDLIAHPGKYDRVAAKGASGYVINLSFDKETGEVIDKDLVLDEEKIAEEEKYDGYYSIVTSELKMSDMEIREIYRGLARIEDTFRLTKAELDTRPIYCRTNEHIEAHFSICFTSIVLIRLLEKKLNEKYPTGRLLHSLREYNCVLLGRNIFLFPYYDEILEDCGKVTDNDLSLRNRRRQDIRRLLKY